MDRFSLTHPSGARTDLVVANSLDLMRRMKPGSCGVLCTSPPYNLGIKYEAYDDAISRADYLAWSAEWLALAYRVLADDGSFFLNIAGKPTDPLVPFQVLDLAIKAGFKLQNFITWVKNISVEIDGKTRSVGHFKPLQSERFVNDCQEPIFHLTKGGGDHDEQEPILHLTKGGNTKLDRLAIGVPLEDKSNIKRFGGEGRKDIRCGGNCWMMGYDTIQAYDDRPHPASFPVELPTRCLKLHGVHKKPLVLDPFAGIGTTALACAKLGLQNIGVDLGPLSIDWAVKRLQKEVPGTKVVA